MAFYAGFKLGSAEQSARSGSTPQATPVASSAGLEDFREVLLERFNKEIADIRQAEAQELSATTVDGKKVRVRNGDLEPLGPDELRYLEQIS